MPVERVSISQPTAEMEIGETIQLSATVSPSNATHKEVTWSSSKKSVASVSDTGLVTALAEGSTTIYATADGKTAECTITVSRGFVEVTSISLNKESLSLIEGDSETLISTVKPDNATDKTVTWSTSDASVATVDNGVVTAKKDGSATITAKAGQKQASCIVTVAKQVIAAEYIELNKTCEQLKVGETVTLTATIKPDDATDKTVTWITSDASVAKVDNGVVTAMKVGNATITAKAGDKSATCSISVVPTPVTSVTLDKTSVTLKAGETVSLTATVKPDDATNKTVTWNSSNESVATVDQTGNVTAKSIGNATINATANDGSGKYASCSVTVIKPVTSISLNKTNLILYRGASDVTGTLTASVIPSDASNMAVTWSSSISSVASVSSSGVVTGKSKGTTTITVTANDGYGASATCEVEVKQWVTSITLDKKSLGIEIGGDATLTVTSILPENANDKSYTWSSDDNAIASVDNQGRVTAKANGNTTISVTANDGSKVFAYCPVVIYNVETYNKIDIPQAVDMGIVVSGKNIKWATFNIGAISPEESGFYYAWGEIEPKSYYDVATYKWWSDYNTLTKYNTSSSDGIVDNKMELDPEDDVAHVKLGGKWRIPTSEEWIALYTQCSWTETTQNGVYGRLVTAQNGNSIFLPAAGSRGGANLYDVGYLGVYWSSSLITYTPKNAWNAYFSPYGVDGSYHPRDGGLPIRPVTE